MIWDIYLRFFHWFLAASTVIAIASGLSEKIDIHVKVTQFIVFLIIFRTLWGIVGSKTSKFSHLKCSPKSIREYLSGSLQVIGHSPLGSVSAIVMLFSVLLQALSGLFATDKILFEAPFYQYIDKNLQEILQSFHTSFYWIIIILIIMHISAILFYKFKGKSLVKAMITGEKSSLAADNFIHLKAIISIIISLSLTYLIYL